MVKIYLDVCCLNRPFDDQSQDRVRIESDAIKIILERIEEKRFLWYGSEVMFEEIKNTPDHIRRNEMYSLCSDFSELIYFSDQILERGNELSEKGFTFFDALHIACCESTEVDIFLTTDDKLIKRAKRLGNEIKVKVENPLLWIKEKLN